MDKKTKNSGKLSSPASIARREAALAGAVDSVGFDLAIPVPQHSKPTASEVVVAQPSPEQIVVEPKEREAQKPVAPPKLHKWSESAVKIRQALSAYASSNAGNKHKAEKMLAIMNNVHSALDVGDEDVKDFADILLSATNLTAAAKAYGVDNPIRALNLVGRPAKASRERLCALYDRSEAVRNSVDAITKQEDGIFLLATLMSSEQRYNNYAGFITENSGDLTELQQHIHVQKQELEGFTAEELTALATDPQVIALRQALQQLSRRERARIDLGKEIRQALKREEDIAEMLIPLAQPAPPTRFKVPASWQPILEQERFFVSDAPESHGKNFICVRNKSYPYIFTTIRANIPDQLEANFQAAIIRVRTLTQVYNAYLDILSDLVSYGFVFESETFLRHPEYGLIFDAYKNEKEGRDPIEASWSIKEKFHEKFFQQESLMRSMQSAGITLSKGEKGSIIMSHPDMPQVECGQRGFFDEAGFATAEKYLNDLQRKKSQPPAEAQVLPEKEPAPLTPSVWSPPAGRTVVTYDANTLQKLCASRANDRTWLDLIKETARLPNITVMIPAVIADWELQGRIPVFDAEGVCKSFEQVHTGFDTHYRLNHISKPVHKFLESASRAHVAPNGTMIIEPNLNPSPNRNIIIVDMEEDKALYNRIREINRLPEPKRKEQFAEEIHGKDKGEQAINRMVKALPPNVAAMIISDDFKYFNSSSTPHSTGRGMPVGQASTASYLDAEIMAREATLRSPAKLNESMVLTVYRISKEIKAFWKHVTRDDDQSMREHSQPGKYGKSHDQEPDTIYSLIHSGVEQLQTARPQQPRNGNGNGKSHADAALRTAVTRSPIDPVLVHDRSGAAAGRE